MWHHGPVLWKTLTLFPGTGMEDGWPQDDSSALHVLCILLLSLLHQLHLRSSNIRSRRPGTPVLVHGIEQQKSGSQCSHVCDGVLQRGSHFSHVQLCVIPWTAARQAPLSMGFSAQEYWSGLPFPPPGNLPDPGIKPTFLASPSSAGRFFTTSTTWEAPHIHTHT